MPVKTKQFQILTDIDLAWGLMTDVFCPDERNGPAAPFFEYAVNSSWLDKRYLYRNRFWMDGDRPVAFVFYENPITQIHFVLRPGYEALADEMIAYAENAWPGFGEEKELVLTAAQEALIRAAETRGYRCAGEDREWLFDFRTGKLDYPLPEGYHFVNGRDADPLKAAKCLWDGFNSEELGPFVNWNMPTKDDAWTPHALYSSVLGATMAPPPHATYAHDVIIADDQDEYVCFSGMWWVEKNRLAYMEPLCTAPAHRHKGLAAAALSRHDKNLRPLGAEIMTGGGNPFYPKIGYRDQIRVLYFRKQAGP